MSSTQALVTIVVATYNRPDTLRHSLTSAILQSETRWRMLVIGDHCDDDTRAVIESLADPRICYINLPQRCCEQAGPNSVGMLLADTPYIALLNHDDLWLPDHLQLALESLQQGRHDLYIARSAFCLRTLAREGGPSLPHFSEASPEGRSLLQAYTKVFYLFEPSSSWVMRRELVSRVGPWRSGRLIHRTALQDWLMRAWRKGARLHADAHITSLKFNTHYQKRTDGLRKPTYSWGGEEQRQVLQLLRQLGSARMREHLERDLNYRSPKTQLPRDFLKPMPALPGWPGRPWQQTLQTLLLSKAAAWLYRLTGLDGFNLYCRSLGIPLGERISRQISRRVGEDSLPPPYDLDSLLDFARKELERRAESLGYSMPPESDAA